MNPSNSHTKCPTSDLQHYIELSTPLPADPSHSRIKCPTINKQQYISNQYATPYSPPHNPIQNIQLQNHSSKFQFCKPLPLYIPTFAHKMSKCEHTAVHFNSVRHVLLNPSHSHKKCRNPNTQQYIKFSTPHPVAPSHSHT